MQVAFYKGDGGLFNKAIRKWTGSEITHVELVVNGVWYSSSHMDGGVRSRVISGNSGNWVVKELDGYDEEYALKMFMKASGHGYDWLGIAGSQVLPFGIHWPWWYFCSELVGKMLAIDKPHTYAPHELDEILNYKK